MMFGIWPLDALSVFGLPLIFLVIGLLLALWAPLSRGGGSDAPEAT
jgi:hypothetical protein